MATAPICWRRSLRMARSEEVQTHATEKRPRRQSALLPRRASESLTVPAGAIAYVRLMNGAFSLDQNRVGARALTVALIAGVALLLLPFISGLLGATILYVI